MKGKTIFNVSVLLFLAIMILIIIVIVKKDDTEIDKQLLDKIQQEEYNRCFGPYYEAPYIRQDVQYLQDYPKRQELNKP